MGMSAKEIRNTFTKQQNCKCLRRVILESTLKIPMKPTKQLNSSLLRPTSNKAEPVTSKAFGKVNMTRKKSDTKKVMGNKLYEGGNKNTHQILDKKTL